MASLYKKVTSFGLPSTHAISRRYQYGFPLITFLYRLAIPLGHRRIRGRSQANTPKKPSSAHSLTEPQDIKVELAGVSDDLGVCVMFMLVRWGVMVC